MSKSAFEHGDEREHGAASFVDGFCFVFRAMRYVNDSKYLIRSVVLESENVQKKRTNNVELYQTESPSSATSSMSFKLLAVKELRNLKFAENIFICYVDNLQLN